MSATGASLHLIGNECSASTFRLDDQAGHAIAGSRFKTGEICTTISELSGALADARVTAPGEQPALALTPEQMGAPLVRGTARLMAKPVAELERDRAALCRATGAFYAARKADLGR